MGKALKKISDALGVTSEDLKKQGVFDAIVDVDNKLFIEPRLLNKCKIPQFASATAQIEKHFSGVISLINASKKQGDTYWKLATRAMTLGEAHGFALGHGVNRPNGRGVGPVLAEKLILRAEDLLRKGVEDPLLFEVVGLFSDGFGPDLISDMQARILEPVFLRYSQDVAKKLNVKDVVERVWGNESYLIPRGNHGGLVLVPESILTPFEIAIDPSEMTYAAGQNQEVRTQLNKLFAEALKNNVPKGAYAEVLFKHGEVANRLVEAFRKAAGNSYDFDLDPLGIMKWFDIALDAASKNPIEITLEGSEPRQKLITAVDKVIVQFRRLVEMSGLWREFYDKDGEPRHERFGQLLFFGIADSYCDANNLDLSREPNAGSGPVDFKLSQGANFKYLVEIKLSRNPKLVHGYETQLNKYQQSEKSQHSAYLVIRVSSNESEQLKELRQLYEKVKNAQTVFPKLFIVDASPQKSASKA